MSPLLKILLIITVFLFILAAAGPFLIPVPPLQGTVSPRALAGPDSQFINLLGIDVHYEQAGKGEPVYILLHGFASSTYSWREVMRDLGEKGTVVAYDRPAFGLSGRPLEWEGENPYGTDFQPKLLIALMDSLGADQAVLVGNSAGGAVAVHTALLYPERVKALVLVSPAVGVGGGMPGWVRPVLQTPQADHLGPLLARSLGDRGTEFAASAWHDPSRITPEIWEGYTLPLKADNWDRALWEMTRASQDVGLSERLGELDLPVLVLAGDDDRIVPFERSEQTANSIPGAVLVKIQRCGHVPQEECPEAFLFELARFVH
jgi:pimeloyl-ACP methyl ester carboxylesterase